jgi:YegS/Rv2252/BmrU family lipid kinase
VVETARSGEAGPLVRDAAPSVDAVFVLGGDGTVMEVVGALAHTGRPVGVLPGGTGNLLAGALGIPTSLRRAVSVLLAGHTRRIDLGRFSSGVYFTFAAGLGIDAAMIAGTTRLHKQRLGVFAYALTAARRAWNAESFDLTAVIDDVTIRTRATLAMVVNAGSLFGGLVALGPAIVPDDGLLDVCIVSTTGPWDVLDVAQRVLRREFAPHGSLRYVKGRRVRLESHPAHMVQADGELIGTTPVEITVQPSAATLLVPRPGNRRETGAGG